MAYTDGYLIPIPKKNVDSYRGIAEAAGALWREYGALDYKECVADDLNIEGMTATYTEALDLSDDETLILAWIVYESREERDRINKAVMEDPRMDEMSKQVDPWPFDPKRMLFGGFKILVDA
jgi:uncharacterized protein YbaA (DUF1428 family)